MCEISTLSKLYFCDHLCEFWIIKIYMNTIMKKMQEHKNIFITNNRLVEKIKGSKKFLKFYGYCEQDVF